MTFPKHLHRPKGMMQLIMLVVAATTTFARGAEENGGGTDRFAARLVISIIGAGEHAPSDETDKNETVDGDKHAGTASRHHFQFVSSKDFHLPTQHIMITSDPELRKWVPKLSFKGKASLAGVVENAIPAFDEMLSPNASGSLLNQAIKRLTTDPECKRRIASAGLDSILPLLKVDIVIDGELAKASVDSIGSKVGDYGISSFKDPSTIGTEEQWREDGTVIGPPMIDRLMARLSNSTVHVYIKTCKAGLNGRMFDQAMKAHNVRGWCLCITDAQEDDFNCSVVSAPFTWAMPSRGEEVEAKPVLYAPWKSGAENVMTVLPKLMDRCALFIMAPQEQGIGDKLMPVFVSERLIAQDTTRREQGNYFFKDFAETLEHRNRLYGFAWTSADSVTGEALRQIVAANNGSSSLAEKLLKAEYTEELPKADRSTSNGKGREASANEDMQRITRYLADAQRSLGTWYDENPRRTLDVTVYETNFQAFKKAIDVEQPEPAYCASFAETLHSIYEKLIEEQKQNGKPVLSDLERDLYDAYQAFVSHAGDITMSTQWPRMVKGEVPVKDFLDNMWNGKELFIALKEKWFEYVAEGKKNKATAAMARAREKMMKHAAACFDAAYDSAREQVFTLLKREALSTRLMKMEATAHLLATHPESLPAGKADEWLHDLADKLQHITQDHVGPWMD